MRKLVRSSAYARTRVVVGIIAAALGVVVVVRTFTAVGANWAATPAYILGGALVALGVVRVREYYAWHRAR